MRIKLFHYIGRALAIHFKVDGLPYWAYSKESASLATGRNCHSE